MENNNKHGSGSGFTWGVLLGAAITLLVTTKKGRKILKELSEVGLEALEKVSEMQNPQEIVEEDEELSEEMINNNEDSLYTEEEKENNGHKTTKRFFKGIKKKTS